jgi:hypothetical protein
VRDVLLLACAWRDAGLGAPHVDDPALAASDACNRRGIVADVAACRALEELQGALEAEAEDRAALASGGVWVNLADPGEPPCWRVQGGEVTPTTLRSPSALLAWIRAQDPAWLASVEAAGEDGPEDVPAPAEGEA